ncbi:MAG: response regulator [Gorillibacterium sp.]|nr:response regulator [Gorillibacterium sp.]
MYKVLIVDDEPAIRNGLRTLVNWSAYGFEVAGVAANGREALTQYQETSPQLMVVDIRMPGMDGLELIEEIRKTDRSCHFIILSGYADFSYAKQAIGWSVNAYILKPVDEEELENELRRISSILDEEAELADHFFSEADIADLLGEASEAGLHTGESGKAVDIEFLADKLFFALDLGSKEKAKQIIEDAGQRITQYMRTEEFVKTSFAQILTIALNKLSAVSHEHYDLAQEYIVKVPELYRQQSFQGMLDQISKMTTQITEGLGNASNVPTIHQILHFIEQHYGENLKLETIAELFNYNSGYLGKLLKSQTGENFNTHLDRIRISRSIELLGSGMKVHQVATRVGYANVDYFHGKFKKYTGTTPSSYKGKPLKPFQANEANEQ